MLKMRAGNTLHETIGNMLRGLKQGRCFFKNTDVDLIFSIIADYDEDKIIG